MERHSLCKFRHQRCLCRQMFPFVRKSLFSTTSVSNVKGVVEGVWMFCRHGDRTPSRSLCPEEFQSKEAAYWMTRLPTEDSAFAFESFSKAFPPKVFPHTNRGQFLDVHRNPYGFLTQKGIEQLSNKGKAFFQRYNEIGYHLPNQRIWKDGSDFTKAWDVTVYSTNYLRTVLSVQSFLDGFWGARLYRPTRTSRKHDINVIKEARVPHHEWKETASTSSSSGDSLVSIQIREQSKDPLNAFDRNPRLLAKLVSQVVSQPDFLAHDAQAATLAARLAYALPGLVRDWQSSVRQDSPSGIPWVEAADHFVCRNAQGLDLGEFTLENDSQLRALEHPTLVHLAWRFRQWYRYPPLLAAIAVAPLREIAASLETQYAECQKETQTHKRPFTIYSCHDITILGILYAIKADFLENDHGWRYFWPEYASTLVIELVDLSPGNHGVRILLNDRAVVSTKSSDKEGGVLTVSEFNQLWQDLQRHSQDEEDHQVNM